MPEVFWERLTASALRELAAADAIVLLPVASTEQHGPHLATGVDTILAREVCRRTAVRLAARQPAVVAPAVWMGLAEHHVGFGGTFSLSFATWHALLRDLCRSILAAGFKRVVIVNGHGGNMAALNVVTTELRQELDAPIASTTYWTLPQDAGAFARVLEDQETVLHACEAETSMMMVVAPDLVDGSRLSEAFGPQLTIGAALNRPIQTWRSFTSMTPTGVIGDARRSSAAKGEALLDSAAELLAQRLLAGEPWASTDN